MQHWKGDGHLIRLRSRHGREPRELAAMDVNTHLDDGLLKEKYVATMFDVIAPGYDAFTHLFSFGMDQQWKKVLVRETAKRVRGNAVVVDLACGTGDLGAELTKSIRPRLALGLDSSHVMLAEAKARRQNDKTALQLSACNILQLGLKANSVDVVTIGYGLRNVVDAAVALREAARVLRPGGTLASLDFYKPAGRVWRALFLWYMWNAGKVAGWLWHREPITYGYLAASIRRYLTITQYEKKLAEAAFQVEWRAVRLGGAIGIHIARRTTAVLPLSESTTRRDG